jgi:hypothetical protein
MNDILLAGTALITLSQPVVCGLSILYILLFVRYVSAKALLTIPAAIFGFWLGVEVGNSWYGGGYGTLITAFLALGGGCAAFIITTGVVCMVNKTYYPFGIIAVVYGLSFPVAWLLCRITGIG